jgi:hypothetical protein
MHAKIQLSITNASWEWFRTNLSPDEQELFLDELESLEELAVPPPMHFGHARETSMTLELPVTPRVLAVFTLERTTERSLLTLNEWRLGSNN